ncbi:hypothetical protein FOCC_FOCC009504 [Frankliniella occidentalis]|nr:hypothetical protein FOCC_FOCC009504 [Frankliniella occidentalis]
MAMMAVILWALLGDKTTPVLCHNMNSERALALVRALPQLVTVVECPAEGSKRSIETKGSKKVCVNFGNPVDIPLIGGLVLTCRPDEALAPPVVGLLPARGTTEEAPVLESAVNVDKDNTFWDLSGTADCSAPKPTPFPCEPTTSSTEAAATTTPTTMSTATDTPTATTATATATTATTATATATGSSTASTADPATAGTQTPSPSGSPGLMAPPAPLLALAAARALTLLARRLG